MIVIVSRENVGELYTTIPKPELFGHFGVGFFYFSPPFGGIPSTYNLSRVRERPRAVNFANRTNPNAKVFVSLASGAVLKAHSLASALVLVPRPVKSDCRASTLLIFKTLKTCNFKKTSAEKQPARNTAQKIIFC